MNKRLFVFLIGLLSLLPILTTAREVDPLFGDTIDRTAPDFVIASLCVADPTNFTDDYLGVAGHAWIRLQCPIFGFDFSFTYEGESVNENLWRFLTKKTKMGMFCYETLSYIEDYQHWNRAVHEYRLNLPPDVEQRLWKIMDEHVNNHLVLPQDLTRYGCATTAAHFVVMALQPEHITYANPSDTDKLYFPKGLVEVWSQATLNGEPLITYVGDLVEAPAPTWWDIWWNWKIAPILCLIIVGIILLIVFICHHKKK